MKKGYRHLIVIVDESGSMGGVVDDTIGGMKAFITSQQKDAETGTLTAVFFEGGIVKRVHSFTDLKTLKLESLDVYQPRGSTNLLDAIGDTLTLDGQMLCKMAEEDRPEKVVVCVLTDGVENCSREYNAKQIKSMIKTQEETYSWDINFISEDLEALDQAASYGFQRGKVARYSKDNTNATFMSMSSKVSRSISGENEDFTSDELAAMVN